MSVEDKERLEKELKEKVLSNMNGVEELAEFFETQLGNFSYRYIESESTAGATANWTDEKTIMIEIKEHTLAHALKTDNPTTRAGLIELAKSFHKKDNPCVRYQLGVRLHNVNAQGGGEFEAFAETHWDFPSFENNELRNQKSVKLSFEDALELRNNFARHLEEVCTVF
jgi:hypothetical protein